MQMNNGIYLDFTPKNSHENNSESGLNQKQYKRQNSTC